MCEPAGLYDDTLIVFSADNGGPVYCAGCAGANNWPLRGGKASNWQGGIRVNSWVSGGLVPSAMHGMKLAGLAAVWDWYGTFAGLAGADPTDHRAEAAGLPPVDSVDLWSAHLRTHTHSTFRVSACAGFHS